MKKLILLVIGSIGVIGLVLGLTLPRHKTVTTTPVAPKVPTSFKQQDQKFTNLLTPDKTIANLTPANTTIISTDEPVPNWFVVTLAPSGGGDRSKAIYEQAANGSLSLVAGPGTSFSSNALQQLNVPQAVQDMLVVYEDQ